MKNKSVLMLLLVLILTVTLTGCGKNNASENAKVEKKDKVILRFATWDTGELLKIQQDIAKKFEEKHPDVKVQVEAYGDGFDQKLVASFGAKNPPDIMYMWDFPTYHQSLLPLDDYIKSDKDININDFYLGLLNYMKVNSVLYGLPAGFTTHVIYYNKKLFDDAKVSYPEEGWTWQDFIEKAKMLSNPTKKQFGFGVRATPDPYDFEQFLWSNGTSYISPDGKKIDGYMNSEEAVEAIQMFVDMVKNSNAVLVGGENQQSGDDIFKAGKIAMWESGIWPMEGFKEAKIDFGIVGLPAFPGKPVKSVVNVSAVSIAKDSKNKDLAWEFLKFYTSEEAILMRKGDFPVRKSVVEKTNFDQDPMIKPFYDMLEGADKTPAFLLNPKWNEIQKNLSAALEASFSELGNVKQLLDKAVKDSQTYLE
jgi:multiple sugar transport system substrate-binding protein